MAARRGARCTRTYGSTRSFRRARLIRPCGRTFQSRSSGLKPIKQHGFDAETTINRQDFNMTWNRVVEGSAMLSDEVKIEIDVAAVEQPK
ncbi:MAG TPA: YceI family protein [Chloroflexota bacterium]